jgi:hypothetical protein
MTPVRARGPRSTAKRYGAVLATDPSWVWVAEQDGGLVGWPLSLSVSAQHG